MNTPVSGVPRALLRVEGLAMLASAVIAYHLLGASWSLFAIAFLAPDLALVAYLSGPRMGAVAYNTVHTYQRAFLVRLAAHTPPVLPRLAIDDSNDESDANK